MLVVATPNSHLRKLLLSSLPITLRRKGACSRSSPLFHPGLMAALVWSSVYYGHSPGWRTRVDGAVPCFCSRKLFFGGLAAARWRLGDAARRSIRIYCRWLALDATGRSSGIYQNSRMCMLVAAVASGICFLKNHFVLRCVESKKKVHVSTIATWDRYRLDLGVFAREFQEISP